MPTEIVYTMIRYGLGRGDWIQVPPSRVHKRIRCYGETWVIHDAYLKRHRWSRQYMTVTHEETGMALVWQVRTRQWRLARAMARGLLREWGRAELLNRLAVAREILSDGEETEG